MHIHRYHADPTLWMAKALAAGACALALSSYLALGLAVWLLSEARDAETSAELACPRDLNAEGSLVACEGLLTSCSGIMAGHAAFNRGAD